MWRVAVCTWNVQGLPPPSISAIRPVLLLHSFSPPDPAPPEPTTPQVPAETVAGLQRSGIVVPDMYAITLQEADLSAEALLRSTGLSAPLSAWEACFSDALGGLFYGAPYTLVRAKQLGGLALFLYARSALLPRLAGVLDGSLPFGWGGVLANKGAVAIRVLFNGVPCVFIGAHLTPHAPNAARRNAEVTAVMTKLQLGGTMPLQGHALTVWAGDLNYRLDVSEADGLPLVKARQWGKLAQYDQLKAGGAFAAFSEEALTFCPSYKFMRDGRFATDRLPAFTDRVLYLATSPLEARCIAYNSVPLLLGDHLPVQALLQIQGTPPAPVPPPTTQFGDFVTIFDLARVPGSPAPPNFAPLTVDAAPGPTEAETTLGERPYPDMVWISPQTIDTLSPYPAPLPTWPLMAIPPLLWQTVDSLLMPENARLALHPRGALASLARLLGPGAICPRSAVPYVPDERLFRLMHPLQLACFLFLVSTARQLIARHGHNSVALAYVLSRFMLPEPRAGAQPDVMQRMAQFMVNLIAAPDSIPIAPSAPPAAVAQAPPPPSSNSFSSSAATAAASNSTQQPSNPPPPQIQPHQPTKP